MFNLDVTNCVERLHNYYICSKCNKEYVFSNLQGRSCEKCDKPDGKCSKMNAAAKLAGIRHIFNTYTLRMAPTKFTLYYKGTETNWIVKETTGANKQNPLGEIPLHYFCKKLQSNELEESVASDLNDINHKDFANWTPLHEAVENDFFEGAQILLKHGAVCDVPGMDYITPLHKACMKNNEKIIKLLIDYGANINSVNCFGAQPFDYITNKTLKRKLEKSTEKCALTRSVYVASIAKICVCSGKESDLQENLNMKFKNYKLAPLKSATHLLVKENTLSFDILYAVLKGLIIYDQSKMKSANYGTVYTLNFDFIPSFKPCFKEALVKRFLGCPSLFDKMSFHVLKHNKPIEIEGLSLTTNDLVGLIKAGGGEVLRREPTPSSVQSNFSAYHLLDHPTLKRCTNFVIFDEREPPMLLYSMKELHHKSSRWLIESILRYKFM